jgi:hypothetical protein
VILTVKKTKRKEKIINVNKKIMLGLLYITGTVGVCNSNVYGSGGLSSSRSTSPSPTNAERVNLNGRQRPMMDRPFFVAAVVMISSLIAYYNDFSLGHSTVGIGVLAVVSWLILGRFELRR